MRKLLREHWMRDGRPGGEVRVLPSLKPSNYTGRHFSAVCAGANLEGHSPKDLRDTYASHLLTCGVPLIYVSHQLGHQEVATTSKHYARYVDVDGYRAPPQLEPGDVPADLIAKRCEKESHQQSHQSEGGGTA